MKKILFTKMVASGNDFIVIDRLSGEKVINRVKNFVRKACNRKYGIGADGVLVLEKSPEADVRMRIFNADGSEAEMCGNGARCAALYTSRQSTVRSPRIKIETKAGIIEAEVKADSVKVKLTDPKDIQLDMPVTINGRDIRVNFVDTGVPHAVLFTEGLHKIDVVSMGREIRYHKKFFPRGTNVDFVEVVDANSINVRTYERGVEDETLACGTGSVAAALIFALKTGAVHNVKIHTQSTEVLTVYFTRLADDFKNVRLEGRTQIVFEGNLVCEKDND